MGKFIELTAGDRYKLTDENCFLQIITGAVEVYAVTADKSEFRQTFLMKLKDNDAAFPAVDEFQKLDTEIYAVSDVKIKETALKDAPEAELKRLMSDWFYNLVEVPWIRLQADRDDDVLNAWQKKEVFEESDDLIKTFRENQQIFAMLLGVWFISEDKLTQKRQFMRDRQKRRLINASIGALLDEESILYEESAEGKENIADNITFAVKSAAKAFNLPASNISIAPDIAKKLTQVEILRRLSAKANIAVRFTTLEKNWHKKDCGVIIGYYGSEKEPVALIPASPSSYRVVLKKNPEGQIVTEEIAAKIDSDAFCCYAGFPRRKLKIMDLWRFMFNSCWKRDYRTILLVSFFAGLIPLVTPIITETIFQDIIPILDRQGLVTVTQVMMVTSFTMAALSVIRATAVFRIGTRTNMAVEAALWSRLMTLPESFFQKFTTGELASRMRGMEALKTVVSGDFVSTVCGTIFSFWSLFLMCWYSVKLTAVAVAVWIVWCFITAFIYRRVISLQRKLIKASNEQAGLVQQIFTGLSKFRVRGAEEQAYHLWSGVFGETWKYNLALRWQNNYNIIIGAAQPFILTMLLYYIAVYEMGANGGMGYAQFIAFEAAYTSFNASLNSLIPLVGEFFTIKPHIENLSPILEAEPEVTDDKPDADPLSGAFEVSNLTFSYGEDKDAVLKDISFRVKAGENLAIVGKSGCGKSTLVRLLLGFEKPKTGAIYYDGQSLEDLSLPSVRSQMGVVLQNGKLMTGDIYTNIVGQSSLTQDDAWEAAEAAGIAEDIRAMPMGMQTVISEGSNNISGGQRQRLMIARALATKPAILILDEATSALDNRTQSIVTNSIDKLNVTRVVIAHRLSTIKNADRILVIDDGKIVESGKYDDLMDKNGIFAKLVKRQVM